MSFRKTSLALLLLASAPAFATPLVYTQTFDGDTNGFHISITFTADDTNPTVVTSFTGTSNADPLVLLAPGAFVNDNVFDPGTLSSTGSRGWNGNGLSFQDTSTGTSFNLYDGGDTSPYLANSNPALDNDVAINFQTSSPSASVDEPASLALFALGGLGLGWRRRKAA